MVDFLYTGRFCLDKAMVECIGAELDSDDGEKKQHWTILSLIKCYVAADKYEIPHMAGYTLREIRDATEDEDDGFAYYMRESFPDTIKFVYDNTHPASSMGRRLRVYFLGICKTRLPALYLNPRFQSALDPVDEFWKELVRAQADIAPSNRHGPAWCKCPNCDECFPVLLGPGDHSKTKVKGKFCPFCVGLPSHSLPGINDEFLIVPAPADDNSPAGSDGVAERKRLVEHAIRRDIKARDKKVWEESSKRRRLR
ncbi:uncharacterized protein BKCO1_3900062 [Diplodia corticola]|uniref:Uncharacterized protein n=1 Tax=Diplodia corticola TaxID=236234 RepID=A0A1J9QV46_9PEZI|nr:uncharacterized protein BKCO1_3900062 [Diplodia corticola]OJD32265.1 hypothetical protein BKCO1_3900062 [Diplodia corticola]